MIGYLIMCSNLFFT